MFGKKHEKLLYFFNSPICEYIPNNNVSIYHYTSPDGLNSIISNSTLRFTDRNYLNDYTEGRYIMMLCMKNDFTDVFPKEHIDKFKSLCQEYYNNPLKKKVPTFQCSFSTLDNILPMWNYYSKNDGIKGYNIGFESDFLISNIKTYSYREANSSDDGLKIRGGEVIYDVAHQIEIVKKVMSKFSPFLTENKGDKPFCDLALDILTAKLLFIGSFFKDECFSYEKEYRLLITPTINPVNQEYFILHKKPQTVTKNGLIIPIIDLEFKKEALQSIKISPTLDYNEAESSLRNALNTYSYPYEEIEITPSGIPVRY